MKIQITEKDIHYILKESTKYIKKILKEYGTRFDPTSLSGLFSIAEYVYDYAEVNDEVVERFFAKYPSIPQEVEYEVYETGGVSSAGPDDCGGDIIEDKASIARVQEINNALSQITPETPEDAKICQTIQTVLNELESPHSVDDLDYKLGGYFNNKSYLGQGDWEPDPDTMPGGPDYYE